MADLTKTLLFDKVRGLQDGRRSGILVVTHDDVTKGLFLRAGQIVFASSTVEKDKLGENLIRLGRISRADFAAAYQSQGTSKRLGQTLVGAGLVTEEELGRAVAQQIEKIVISLFTWQKGEMRFHESADPIPADLAVDVSTHRLLLEGARVYPEVARLEKSLGNLERKLRIATHPPFEYDRLTLSPAEQSVLADAADGHPVAEMLSRPKPRSLLLRAVYALWVGGVLEEPEDAAEIVIEEDTGTFRLALAAQTAATAQPPLAAPAEPDLVGIRERLLKLYESIPRATHYEVLGVAPDASDAAIVAAHGRLEQEHERDWSLLKSESRLSSMISTLRLRQRESYRILSDAGRRANYDRTLGALKPAATPVVTEKAHNQAARDTRKARDLLESGQTDLAITLLLKAVNEDPRDLETRRMLALTLATHPTLARTAERHFLAGLEIDPQDAALRFGLAQYYRKAGLRRRAISQYQHVLQVMPDHKTAKRELGILQALEDKGL